MSVWLEALESSLSQSPHGVHEVESGREMPYPDLLDASRPWERLLAGTEKEFVAVVLPNGITYLEVYLGEIKSRNIFNPIPYFVGESELESILSYVEPTLVVTDRADLKESLAGRYRVVDPADVGDDEGSQTGDVDVLDDDVACLYYSSGTTGNPKGVLYSHSNVYELIASICRGFKHHSDTRQFAFLPFGHTASINYNILPALLLGSPLYTSLGFEHLRANFFDVLANHRINYVEVVPSVLLMLLKLRHKVEHLDLSSLEFVGCGSSTLPLETQREFTERYGLPVANLYGLSETGPSHIDDPRDAGWEPGSVGFALDVNECKIAEDGEILLKGPNVFVGYYKNPTLYEEVVKDGWFHTGDLGRQDDDGRCYFTDRKKDLIIKSGINIVPAEIEDVIYKCDNVLGCVVVGKEDPVHGEVIAAAIAPRDPDRTEGLVEEVRAVCKAHLSSYKVPNIIEVVDRIPQTHSGKLLRKEIRELFSARD